MLDALDDCARCSCTRWVTVCPFVVYCKEEIKCVTKSLAVNSVILVKPRHSVIKLKLIWYKSAILTATARFAFLAARFAFLAARFSKSPEQIDDNDRRRQRRLVFVLNSETVAIETPHLGALFFHFHVRVATVRYRQELAITQYLVFVILQLTVKMKNGHHTRTSYQQITASGCSWLRRPASCVNRFHSFLLAFADLQIPASVPLD